MEQLYKGFRSRELLFAYEQIILYYEREVKNENKKLRFNKRYLKPFLINNNITIETGQKVSEADLGTKNESFIYLSKKSYDIPTLLRLIRNAFAHNNIRKMRFGKGTFICFWNKTGNNITTMAGQIKSSSFSLFVDALKHAHK